jgi:formylglycine-generating enzyme required for sulfatase activity
LAGTPLFCTSLVLVYKYQGAELPERQIDVFAEIVDLLLGFWNAQDQKFSPSNRMEEDDGIGNVHVDLRSKVKILKRRLAHIAMQMQLSTTSRTEIDLNSLVDIVGNFLVEKESVPTDKAAPSAKQFLINCHERSGLLVETDPSDPPIFAFTHERFREYLVADALANARETKFIRTILDNIDNPTWEDAIVMAGAHPGLSDDLREHLLETCVEEAADCKADGNIEGWSRRWVMAGRMARDMGAYLSPKDRSHLIEVLSQGMLDTANDLKHRIEIALVLDVLGWMTDNLYHCVPFSGSGKTRLFLGRHLVANQQYERFLNDDDFQDPLFWEDPYCVDFNNRAYSYGEESLYWLKSNQGDKRLPKSWNDPTFGNAHRGLPVVGISWFEANAYCRWLKKHWNELEEAAHNPDVRPVSIRLPTEQEWCQAVFGTQSPRRFPWNQDSESGSSLEKELLAFANIGNSLDRTSPAGMFPKGESVPLGLNDVCGNAWEWQANLFDRSYRAIALRGGAFTTSVEDSGVELRGCRKSAGRDNDLGFRILIET